MSPLASRRLLWVVGFLWALSGTSATNAAPFRSRLALGIPYAGAQLHWGFAKKWAAEARVLKGKATTDSGDINSNVYGLRIYNYFRAPTRTRLFWGLEIASTHASSTNSTYQTNGLAAGGFLGAEFYLMQRLSIGLDAGPYVISSKSKTYNSSGSETNFVVNTFMNFYFL